MEIDTNSFSFDKKELDNFIKENNLDGVNIDEIYTGCLDKIILFSCGINSFYSLLRNKKESYNNKKVDYDHRLDDYGIGNIIYLFYDINQRNSKSKMFIIDKLKKEGFLNDDNFLIDNDLNNIGKKDFNHDYIPCKPLLLIAYTINKYSKKYNKSNNEKDFHNLHVILNNDYDDCGPNNNVTFKSFINILFSTESYIIKNNQDIFDKISFDIDFQFIENDVYTKCEIVRKCCELIPMFFKTETNYDALKILSEYSTNCISPVDTLQQHVCYNQFNGKVATIETYECMDCFACYDKYVAMSKENFYVKFKSLTAHNFYENAFNNPNETNNYSMERKDSVKRYSTFISGFYK